MLFLLLIFFFYNPADGGLLNVIFQYWWRTNYFVSMPHTCCVASCNYGYRTCTDKQKYVMFRFPKNAVMKNKRLSAIPCKNWTVTENIRVCSKHFQKKDFKEPSTDERVKRRQARETSQLHRLSLKPSAISHIFLELPSLYNIKPTKPRATTALSSVRIEKEDDRILADLNTRQSIFTEDCGDSTKDLTWLKD